MNVLIIEDEEPTARRLAKLLSEADPAVCIEAITDSIESTAVWLSSNKTPDLVFMDIQLSDGLCFEIFELAKITCPVIFTTAFDEYAIQAFKVSSIDYLLKPVKKEDLVRSLEKLKNLKNHFSADRGNIPLHEIIKAVREEQQVFRSGFLIRSGQSFFRVSTNSIAYFTTENKLTYIVLFSGKRHIADFTLDHLENELDPSLFFRINRQYILNIHSVESIHSWFSGGLKISLNPKTENEVIVPRRKTSAFRHWLDK